MNSALFLMQTLTLTAGSAELSSETTIPLSWMFAIVTALLGSLGGVSVGVLAVYRSGKVEPLQLQVTALEKQVALLERSATAAVASAAKVDPLEAAAALLRERVALLERGQGGLEKSLERVERDIQASIKDLRESTEQRQKAIHDAINQLQVTMLRGQRSERARDGGNEEK